MESASEDEIDAQQKKETKIDEKEEDWVNNEENEKEEEPVNDEENTKKLVPQPTDQKNKYIPMKQMKPMKKINQLTKTRLQN